MIITERRFLVLGDFDGILLADMIGLLC